MLKLTDSDITFSFWTLSLPYDYDSFRKNPLSYIANILQIYSIFLI